MSARFTAPILDDPDSLNVPPELRAFLRGFIDKTQQSFRDLEEEQRRREPGGNIYVLGTGNVTEVFTVVGTSTSTATSTDGALYQLVRELKQKGMIR